MIPQTDQKMNIAYLSGMCTYISEHMLTLDQIVVNTHHLGDFLMSVHPPPLDPLLLPMALMGFIPTEWWGKNTVVCG